MGLSFLGFGILILVSHAGFPTITAQVLNVENHLFRLVRAEDSSTTTTPPPNSGSGLSPNGTTAAACDTRKCCQIYTWPGNSLRDPHAEAPLTCSDLPSIQENRENNVACHDPIIYSNGTYRPNPELVTKTCKDMELNCFCEAGETDSCIKLTYFSSNKNIRNETRFCGTITNVLTDSLVTSGCYQEKIPGTPYTREVCACEPGIGDGFCNGSPNHHFRSSSLFFLPLLLMLIFSF